MERAISVTKFNSYIKQIFDSEELLHNISIVGEVFGVSLSRNVIYFSLKDENASLSCVSFYPNLIEHIIEGQKVIITGSPNYYQKTGKLNFNVIKVESIGQGKLYEEFLKLKKCEHHGISRFDHSLKVSYKAYKFAKKNNLDYKAVAVGGLLHDFFIDENVGLKEKFLFQ